jgi:integrase
MKSELLKEGYAPATVRHCLVLVRQIYNKTCAWDFYKGENPIHGVKMPIVSNQRERFLTQEEAKVLLDALQQHNPQVHDRALLSLHAGMRAGEVAGLRVCDVDLQNELISVADPKNRRPRKIPMSSAVKAMFQSRLIGKASADYIFPGRTGGRLRGYSRTFTRVVRELGINEGIKDPRQKISFHTLRHTFASWLAMGGEPIQVISELLGHRTLAMTMRYAHLTPDRRKQAIDRLEQGMAIKSSQGAQQ